MEIENQKRDREYTRKDAKKVLKKILEIFGWKLKINESEWKNGLYGRFAEKMGYTAGLLKKWVINRGI